MMEKQESKILTLESLRGLAAFGVVLFHFIGTFYLNITSHGEVHSKFEVLLTQTPLFFFINGVFSVTLFFVLSGFVLSSGYFKKGVDLIASVLKRYFRLAPIVLASTLLAFLCLRFGFFHNQEAGLIAINWPNHNISFFEALWEGLVGVFIMVPDKAVLSLNPVLWTIYYELIGSVIVYSTLALCGRDPRRKYVYPLLFFLLIDTGFAWFIIGMILADVYYNKKAIFDWVARLPYFYKLFLLAFAVILASFPPFQKPETLNNLYQPFLLFVDDYELSKSIVYLLASVILIVIALTSTKFRRLLELKPLVYLGSISYSLYATHYIVLGSVVTSMYIWLSRYNLTYNRMILIIFAAYILVSLLIAHIFNKYIDTPSIKFSRGVGKKVEMMLQGASTIASRKNGSARLSINK